MEKQKMSIHRALAELKLIDAKIEKGISEIRPTGIKQKDKLVNQHIDEAEFNKNAQSSYDSVNALIARKSKIKSAIVQSNTLTTVKVAGVEMKVADAITAKSTVVFKKRLAEHLKRVFQSSLSEQVHNNNIVQQNVQRITEATFGKDNVRVTKEDMDSVRKPYLEANDWHLVDPLKIQEKINQLEKETADFETEVDAVLSESNAITLIEV